jgi:hypothetical protein
MAIFCVCLCSILTLESVCTTTNLLCVMPLDAFQNITSFNFLTIGKNNWTKAEKCKRGVRAAKFYMGL